MGKMYFSKKMCKSKIEDKFYEMNENSPQKKNLVKQYLYIL